MKTLAIAMFLFFGFLQPCFGNSVNVSCPNKFRAFEASLDQMQNVKFWAHCKYEDFLNIVQQLELRHRIESNSKEKTDDWTKVYQVIRSASSPQQSLVRVSSRMHDFASDQERIVQGVGSIIEVDSKYFVLTAGHVSLGDSLLVASFDHIPFKISRVISDSENDITLLEIDLNHSPYIPFPLGKYVKRGRESFIATFMQTWSTTTSEINFKDNLSGNNLLGLPLEGLKAVFASGGASAVIKASWLPKLAQFDRTSSNKDRILIDRNNNVSEFLGHDAFDSGYSGSPVAIAYKDQYLGSTFALGGMLNIANSEASTSGFIGIRPIVNLIEQAFNNESDKNDISWALVNDVFVKISPTQIHLYVHSGPVGNGVVIEGKQIEDFGSSKTNFQLQKKGLTKEEITLLKHVLKEHAISTSAPADQNFHKIQILKEEVKKATGSKIRLIAR